MSGKRLLPLLLWLFALLLLWLAMRDVSLTAVFHSLQQLQLWQIAALGLLNFLILIFLTGRWYILLRGLGRTLPFGLIAGHRLAAFGVSYFTPGPQFGGEPVQVLLLEKVHGVSRTTAVSSVALDKTIELLVNFSFLALGMAAIVQSAVLGIEAGWKTAVFPLGLLGLPLCYLIGLRRNRQPLAEAMRFFSAKAGFSSAARNAVQAMAASEKQAARFCQRSPRYFWAALLISLAGWLAMTLEFGVMLSFLGAEVSVLETIVILTAVRFSFLLPLPGGLGIVEASLAATLTRLGFDPAIGLSASLLIRGRDIALGLIGLWWGNRYLSGLLHPLPPVEVSDDQIA